MTGSTIVRTVAHALVLFTLWELVHGEFVSAALAAVVSVLLACAAMSMRVTEQITAAVVCLHCRAPEQKCTCPMSIRNR